MKHLLVFINLRMLISDPYNEDSIFDIKVHVNKHVKYISKY